eukprot:232960_1
MDVDDDVDVSASSDSTSHAGGHSISPIEISSSRSVGTLLRGKHTWTIEHFRHRSHHASLLSDAFKVQDFEFQLKIYPRQTEHAAVHAGDASGDEHFAIFLWCLGAPFPENGVDVHFHVVNQQDVRRSISEFKFPRPHVFTIKNPSKGYWQVCGSSLILDPTQGFVGSDGSLIVTVELEFLSTYPIQDTFQPLPSSLSSDLRSTLTSGRLSDFEIRGPDYARQVHKVILSARSAYFAAMFCQRMRESRENFVEIDVEEEVMDCVLAYIYHDSEPSFKLAGRVLVAADRFQMTSLSRTCQKVLFESLNEDNVIDLAMITQRYPNCDQLERLVMSYMVRNIDQVLNHENFERLMSEFPTFTADVVKTSRSSESENKSQLIGRPAKRKHPED